MNQKEVPSSGPEETVAAFVPRGISESLWLLVSGAIVGVYLAALFLLHCSGLTLGSERHLDFLSSGLVWDHPEPNFMVSPAITEFWSVLTTIPLAGGLLCFQGFRYRLDAPVMLVYIATFLMYNFALVSHCTLWKPCFQLTLTSVMANCFGAFYLYGGLAIDLAYIVPLLERFGCNKCRAKVAIPSVALVALSAVKLPDRWGPGGGVWTLFWVQAPPVWVMSLAAMLLLGFSKRAELRDGYRMVSVAAAFLSVAMFLAYAECKMGTKAVAFDTLGGFPVLHIAVHVSEQIGIYFYGLSLGYLQQVALSPRRGASFGWLFWGMVPYFKCDPEVISQKKQM